MQVSNPIVFIDPSGLKWSSASVNKSDEIGLRKYVDEELDGAGISWNDKDRCATIMYKGVKYNFSATEYTIKSDGRMYASRSLLNSIFKNQYVGRQINDKVSKNVFTDRVNGGKGSYIVGNLQIVKKLGEVNHTFTIEEMLKSDLANQTAMNLLGAINSAGAIALIIQSQ